MRVFENMFESILEIEDSVTLTQYWEKFNSHFFFAAIQFDDSYKDLTDISGIKNFKVSIR